MKYNPNEATPTRDSESEFGRPASAERAPPPVVRASPGLLELSEVGMHVDPQSEAAQVRVASELSAPLTRTPARCDCARSKWEHEASGMLATLDPGDRPRAQRLHQIVRRVLARAGSPNGPQHAYAMAVALINDVLAATAPGSPELVLRDAERAALLEAIADTGFGRSEIHEPATAPSDDLASDLDLWKLSRQGLDRLWDEWTFVSMKTARSRWDSAAGTSDETIRKFMRSFRPDSVAIPVLEAWMAENAEHTGDWGTAARRWSELGAHYPAARYGSLQLSFVARAHEIFARRQLGDLRGAIGRLREWHDDAVGYRVRPLLANYIATLAEESGDWHLASSAYASARDGGLEQAALAGLARICDGSASVLARRDGLVEQLKNALSDRDGPRLRELAARFDFQLGMGCGETSWVPREQLLELLTADLLRSQIEFDPSPVRVSGEKYYLGTSGWRGTYFAGGVYFQLRRQPSGWQWTGIVVPRPTASWGEIYRRFLGPGPKATNQPLPPGFTIKAPWSAFAASASLIPTGYMRAGGLWTSVRLEALLLIVCGLSAVPIVGPIFRVIASAIVSIISLDPCGFGLGGFYYNDPASHFPSGFALDSGFAIDFNVPNFLLNDLALRHAQQDCVPIPAVPLNMQGDPALACQGGTVTRVVTAALLPVMTQYGNGITVEVQHGGSTTMPVLNGAFSVCDWRGACAVAPTTSVTYVSRGPISSRYMHFRPAPLFVSMGMSVVQGSRLGIINSTGRSAFDHLHFELHDLTLPQGGGMAETLGGTLRPTPMSGQTLTDGENGKCIHSDNIPV